MTSGTKTSTPIRVEPGSLTADALAGLSTARGEADWLRDARRAETERYLATPWPTGAEEEWRRTSLKDLPVEATLDETATTEVSDLDPASEDAGVVFAPLGEAGRAASRPRPPAPHRRG